MAGKCFYKSVHITPGCFSKYNVGKDSQWYAVHGSDTTMMPARTEAGKKN